MPSEIDVKFSLADKFSADKILSHPFFARYIKDDFTIRDTHSDYFDTPDWILAENNFFLRVRNFNGSLIAALKRGSIDIHSGIYRGHQWLCSCNSIDELPLMLKKRGAPSDFFNLLADKPLLLSFSAVYRRHFTTLYLPEMNRAELSLDSGLLSAGSKSEALFELGLELLFGQSSFLSSFALQLADLLELKPLLLTKQQRALRLLRSR